jgi:transposase
VKEKLTYDELIERVNGLKKHIAEQDAKIAELERQLSAAKKNSSNSSKPPSSDIVSPKKAPKPKNGKRRIGGQPKHKKHESTLTLSDADNVEHILLENDSDHLGEYELASDLDTKEYFQYELVEKPVELNAYILHPYRHLETGKIIYPPLAKEIRAAGILGPRLTVLAACLKGGIHASYTGIEKVFGFLNVDVCRATICNNIKKVSSALDFAYTELLDSLPTEEHLNIDETGHKDNPFDKPKDHKKHWIWIFAATTFSVFRIFGHRSTDALREVLGPDCEAKIGADFYSAYRCFMKEANVKVQFCWAHLIREIKFLSESSQKTTANYGNRLLKICKSIFELQHDRQMLGEEEFRKKMLVLKHDFLEMGKRSSINDARKMRSRLKKFGKEYFLFIEDPMVEPTNNLAEQGVRHCVIDRRITQGTRGTSGQKWCERIWTTMATCARQKRDAFKFIEESVQTYFSGKPQPSLHKR